MELINVLATSTTDCAGVAIPNGIYQIVHLIILLIQVVVPILLIIWGMLDFAKSVIGGDEDAIKKGQKIFIKRVIAAIIVFLVVTVVTLLISAVGTIGADGVEDSDTIQSCLNNMVHGVK